jgi:gamma-glutamyltranspeptidase/glutathione hydrolase
MLQLEVTMPRFALSTLGALALAVPLATVPVATSTAAPPMSQPAAPQGQPAAPQGQPAAPPQGQPAAAPQVEPEIPKGQPEAIGTGGAVASVDPYATAIGIDVLRRGGNAADAAIATAAALGVTEPYSAGIGGGGFLVYYDARTRKVSTIDSRETAPASFTPTVFTDGNGAALNFTAVVNSGLSVGVPGTPALWHNAQKRFGSWSLNRLLRPAEHLARDGFVVDSTFNAQSAANAERFRLFPETERVFLPGGQPAAVGSTFRNPDLAKAYQVLGRDGVDALYRGELGKAVVTTARAPITRPGTTVYPGQLTEADLRAYRVRTPSPVTSRYRGLELYGMPVPSSGGIAVGEALNLLEAYDRKTGTPLSATSQVQYLHRLGEASATAFADRNRHVGSVPGVPARELLSQRFANERACLLFDPAKAQPRPIPFGSPDGDYDCTGSSAAQPAAVDDHGTTHLTVADKWGNVASYTLTIEQTGGSGITVPGYGFLLNNELTDFNFVPLQAGVPDPNLPDAGKRPRSSMSPTIMMKDGKPWLTLGSPGGATIITTVLQVATGYLDRDLSLVDAIAAPRFSSRNGAASDAEPAIATGPLGTDLRALGHTINANPEIGAASGIRVLPNGRLLAAAETTRRGGGSAAVVNPAR